MKIREWAKGHWPEIVGRLIGEDFANVRKHHPCPRGEGRDCFRFSNVNDCGNFFCKCSQGEKDGFELLMCYHGWDFPQAAEQVERVIGKCPKDGEEVKPKPETWSQRLRREVVKTSRSMYLEGRGLEVPRVLDWHSSLPYCADGKMLGRFPAMLAPITRKGRFITYHVTYLQGGSKAPLDPCRKILEAARGGACELYALDGPTMGVAEGVETAIAAKMLYGVPVWAALNTALLSSFDPPDGVERIIVFADNDKNFAGHAAAYTLAHRLIKLGKKVDIRFPEIVGADWNDVLLNKRGAAA